MFQERFLYDEIEGRPSCHVGTIAELPSGEYLAAFYAGTHEGHTDVAILTAHLRSEIDGWEYIRTVVDTPGKSDGNAVLHVDTYGHVWLFYVTQQEPGWDHVLMYAMKSEDEGRTWEDPISVGDTLGWMPKNKPICLQSGRTVWPCYDERSWRGFCLISDDGCVTWEQSGFMQAPVGVIQPTLIPREDGSILALLRTGASADDPDNCVIWKSVSSDEGMTWSPCERTDLPNPNSGFDAVKLDTGGVVLIYNDSGTARHPLTLALSKDDGQTWPLKRNIETQQAEFSYPSIIQGHGGRIHAIYTYKRTHMKHVAFSQHWLETDE